MSDPGGTLGCMTRTAKLDEDALEQRLGRQRLVISRDQATACGMTPGALRHRIRAGGPWQRLLPGVYLAATGTPTLIQNEIAALLYAGPGSVITGLAALRRHGLRVPEGSGTTVLIPGGRARASWGSVAVWPTIRMPERVCFEGAVQFALVPRAVANAARELASFRDTRAVVADAVQQGRCRIDLLGEELRRGPARRSAWLRRALNEVTGGARSATEGDLRDLIARAGLPMPMFNARLYAGQKLIAVADAWWPRAHVAVEVDSREWHLSPEDWERTLRRDAAMGRDWNRRAPLHAATDPR